MVTKLINESEICSMKKILSLVLVLALSLVAISAMAATGIGSVTSISGSDATAEKVGAATVNTTLCAVTLEDGKVVAVKFDVAQNKVSFDTEGKWLASEDTSNLTKVEKGEAYGMKAASGIGKEVFEQIASLEEYFIGKTPEEILAIETYQKDESHTAVPAGDDLKSLVTITIGDYLAAFEKAVANAN